MTEPHRATVTNTAPGTDSKSVARPAAPEPLAGARIRRSPRFRGSPAGLLLLLLLLSPAASPAIVPAAERAALMALYNATGGASWDNNVGWGVEDPCEGSWAYVGCDGFNSHVLSLDLLGNNLVGTLPAGLDALDNLTTLNLRGNELTGEIPDDLPVSLEILDIANNSLTGPLRAPCCELRTLDLANNGLSDSLPDNLGNQLFLESLDLRLNDFSGAIPATLGDLDNLGNIELSFNELSGSIPASLGTLGLLILLDLDHNNLTGSIPPELGGMSSLGRMDLNHNQLSGSIPAQLGPLPLDYLNLNDNQLSGAIPQEIGDLDRVKNLNLNDNQLDGSIPASLGNLITLDNLHLENNQLTGSIPAELGDLCCGVDVVDLSSNFLSGALPDNLPGTRLFLDDNQLTGPIPPWVGFDPELSELNLSFNSLSGSIPTAGIDQFMDIRTMILGSNQLSGSIPGQLASLTTLINLDLGDNQLTGSIPTSLGDLTQLSGLKLNSNALVGDIPSTLGNLTQLTNNHGLDIMWNGLWTTDDFLGAFLDLKQDGGNWVGTQTIAPYDPTANALNTAEIAVNWTAIEYIADGGGYNVLMATSIDGPFTLVGLTADKTITSFTVSELNPATWYFFMLETVTPPHIQNQNQILSAPSAVFNTRTDPTEELIFADGFESGDVSVWSSSVGARASAADARASAASARTSAAIPPALRPATTRAGGGRRAGAGKAIPRPRDGFDDFDDFDDRTEQLMLEGDFERAASIRRHDFERLESVLSPYHPDLALARADFALALLALGEPETAREHYQLCVAMLRRAKGPDHPYLAAPLWGLGQAFLEVGDSRRATFALNKAQRLLDVQGTDAAEHAIGRFRLARTMAALGLDERAAELAGQAREKMEEAGAAPKLAAEVDRWLALLPPDRDAVASSE